jgi:hypothetical protein
MYKLSSLLYIVAYLLVDTSLFQLALTRIPDTRRWGWELGVHDFEIVKGSVRVTVFSGGLRHKCVTVIIDSTGMWHALLYAECASTLLVLVLLIIGQSISGSPIDLQYPTCNALCSAIHAQHSGGRLGWARAQMSHIC